MRPLANSIWSLVKHPQDFCAGKCLLDLLVKRGLEQHSYQVSHSIRLFAFCGSLAEAYHVFFALRAPCVFAWSAIISAHAKLGQPQKALILFSHMLQSVVKADAHVYVAALTACCDSNALCQGRRIHSQVIENGYVANTHVGGVLIDLYIKSGFVQDANSVFHSLGKQDVVTYTSMLRGFVQAGDIHDAFWIFQSMQDEGIEPNEASFVSIMKACVTAGYLDLGMLVHDHILQAGYGSNLVVCNATIDMYATCGTMIDALKVFHKLPRPDAVSWCTIITGYLEHGQGLRAQNLFQQMQQHACHFDQALFVCSLKVCSSRGALEQGKLVHAHVLETHLVFDLLIGNALVHMYISCGSFLDAWRVFLALRKRNIVTWSTMIVGLAKYKQYPYVLECLEAMYQDGWKPNNVTYASLLASCRDEGLILDSSLHFKHMVERDCIAPTLIHFNCLVDLLSHGGRLNEAADLLKTMPFQHNFVGWTSFLSCCNIHNGIEPGRVCYNHVATPEGEKSAGFVLMSSLYAHEGMLQVSNTTKELELCNCYG